MIGSTKLTNSFHSDGFILMVAFWELGMNYLVETLRYAVAAFPCCLAENSLTYNVIKLRN